MAGNVDLEGATIDGKYYVDSKIQSGYYGATWLSKDLKNGSADVCLKVNVLDQSQTLSVSVWHCTDLLF